ncbi:hypothetical protein K7X08_000965 [Anisodus acutangulus]|uniref:Peroxidase n=1 Tax=Anisodus acutangulus TaxID=402998 RepID=A0A9Q1MRC9_9SOLA|nr:hypothetical protein K7X08_000965 [Anisodus acutangulus]
MAFPKLIFQLMLVILLAFDLCNAQGLKLGYYEKTCPGAEASVKKTTAHYISRAPTLAAPLLRMHFHDCFVRGCDGSVLLNSTKNNQAERDAIPNQSLRGFQVIDAAKSELEHKCPGVVSCADILALVARDAVSLIKGPYWKVPLGRRDGRVSNMLEGLINLPAPFANITSLKVQFASLGLNAKDLVVLSGGHTIGNAHCLTFTNRIYNFTGNGDTDPTMDPNYIARLKSKCTSPKGGLFQSDAALLDDKETKAYVKLQAMSHGSTFFKDFAESMEKMGKVGVLTGKAGEIRKRCAFVN